MSRSLRDLLIIITICLSVYNGVGLAFNIEISPDKVNGLVHNDVNIVCKLDKSDGDVREIMLLELSKEGNRIAVLRQHSELSIRKRMEKKIKAEGNVSQSDVLDSYLHVTLQNPTEEDSGPYTCQLYSLDEMAVLSETRATGNLSVSNQDIKATVMYLVDKVFTLEREHSDRISSLKASHNETTHQLEEHLYTLGQELDLQKDETMAKLKEQKDIHKNDVEQLQNKIGKLKREATNEISALEGQLDKQEQRIQNLIEKDLDRQLDLQKSETMANQVLISGLKAELKEQKDIHKNDVEQLQNKISKLKRGPTNEISALEGQLDKQEQRIQNLIEKVNTTVFFTAWHTRTGNFKNGADMVYSEVLENVGGAYDGSTGKFTAPVDGLYFFDVSVASNDGKNIYLDLKTSDGRLLTRLFDLDTQTYSYSDTSCVTQLLAGESVHPVIHSISGGYGMGYENTKDPLNKFYGYLIKTL